MKKIILFLLLFSQVIFPTDAIDKFYLDVEKELDKMSYDGNAKSFSKLTYKINESPVHYVRPFEGIVGIKAVEVDYINGQREGKVIFNKPTGEIFVEGEYKNDKKNGIWKYYINDFNFLEREQEFKNGIYDGKSILYYQDGKPMNIKNYVNGKKEGEELDYYESGKLWSKKIYVNNKLEGDLEIYYPSGAIYMKSFYKNNIRNYVIYYYESGQLLLEGEIFKEKPRGIWKFYGENQEIKYEGKFEDISPLFKEEFNKNLEKTLRSN